MSCCWFYKKNLFFCGCDFKTIKTMMAHTSCFPNMNKYLAAEKKLNYLYVFGNACKRGDYQGKNTYPILAENYVFMKFKYIRSCDRSSKLKILEHHFEDVLYAFYLLIDAINKKLTLDELVEKTMSYKLTDIHYTKKEIKEIKNKDRITRYWKLILDANIQEVSNNIGVMDLYDIILEKFDKDYNMVCGAYCYDVEDCNLFCMNTMCEVLCNLAEVKVDKIVADVDDITLRITYECLELNENYTSEELYDDDIV